MAASAPEEKPFFRNSFWSPASSGSLAWLQPSYAEDAVGQEVSLKAPISRGVEIELLSNLEPGEAPWHTREPA
jgi:hypothetical protein